YKKHYGPDGDPSILVVQGASRDFNSDLSEDFVNKQIERDPQAASAEFLATFRTDLEALVTPEVIANVTDSGVHERPCDRSKGYARFVYLSRGSCVAMT